MRRTIKRQPSNPPVPPESDTVEGSFFGQKIKFAGRETVYLAILALALSGAGYLLVQMMSGVGHQLEQQSRNISEEHKVGTDVLRETVEALNEQNYIITLSDAERKKLKLSMPRTLREKVKRREDY